MIDARALNRSFDLLPIVEQTTTLHKHGHTWYSGPCPFCGGRDRFVLKRSASGWCWYCRNCGDGKYHSPIDFFMRLYKTDFRQAINRMSSNLSYSASLPPRLPSPAPTPPRSGLWEERGRSFVAECERALWSSGGDRIKRYLNERGLKDETIRRYHLGYQPTEKFETYKDWGVPEPNDGRRHAVRLPSGIVIPCFAGERLFYIKIRQPELKTPKYLKVQGSQPGVFGTDTLVHTDAVFTEGEFDAMLLHQEVGDLVGVATLGSASDRFENIDFGFWGRHLLPLRRIYAIYDQDESGKKGSHALASFTQRALPLVLPPIKGAKDITDYWKAGGDLRAWIMHDLGLRPIEIPPVVQPTPQVNDHRLQVINLSKIVDDYLDEPWRVDPTRSCYPCRQINYRKYPNQDDYVCAVCHP